MQNKHYFCGIALVLFLAGTALSGQAAGTLAGSEAGLAAATAKTVADTATPPSPLPNIFMVADKTTLAASFSETTANPWAGAFDSQGRYIFFDQQLGTTTAVTQGSDTLVRVDSYGPSPTFTVLVTQAQLASYDSAWNDAPYYAPKVTDIAVAPDGSLLLATDASTAYGFRLLHVVLGSPPQITTVCTTSSPVIPEAIAVYGGTNPATVYITLYNFIYTCPITQAGGSPTQWLNFNYSSGNSILRDIALDQNGDLLVSSESADIYRINRTTKAVATLGQNGLTGSIPGIEMIPGFTLDPTTGDIVGICSFSPAFPGTTAVRGLFKYVRQGDDAYDEQLLALETQVMDDPNVSPFVDPDEHLDVVAHGIALTADGTSVYVSNGTPVPSLYFDVLGGTDCVLGLGTIPQEVMTGVTGGLWPLYR